MLVHVLFFGVLCTTRSATVSHLRAIFIALWAALAHTLSSGVNHQWFTAGSGR